MKVAIISDWYLPRIGGLEIHMRDLARELTARGHCAHIITATPGADAIADHRDGVRVHRLGTPLVPKLAVIRSRSALRPLARIFEREGFDVIHAHTAFSPLALAATHLARRMRLPTVLTEHSVLRGGGEVLLRGLSRVFHWSAWPDVLSGVSTLVVDELARLSRRDDVEVLYNYADPREWQAVARRPEEEELVVATIMRLTPRKRPLDFVRAIPRVRALLPPSLRPRFLLLGDGPLRGAVEREVDRLGVREYIELPGFQPRSELVARLARAAVFALPTCKESMSIASLQARCVGLPVVAMSHGGVSDVIEHGRHGFLADDPDDFAGYIARLIRDPALRWSMGEASRRAVGDWSWDRGVPRHLEIYRLAAERCAGIAPAAEETWGAAAAAAR